MKNLLVVTFAGLGEREIAGAPTFWKTVEGFLSAGWKVWVVDIGTKEDTPLGERDYGDGLYVIRFNPPFLRMARAKKIGWFFSLYNTFYIRRKLVGEAKKIISSQKLTQENTVIYALGTYAVHAGKIISQRYNMPLVNRFMGSWDALSWKDNIPNRLRYYPELQAYGMAADIVVAANDGTRTDALLERQHNQSKKVLFWRNGVDPLPEHLPTPLFFATFPKDTPVLMTVCRLRVTKGIDRSIRAMSVVKKTHPNARLIICGDGPARESLEKLTDDLGLRDTVFFVGTVSHDEVPAYLQRADIFLSFYLESNLGNPIYEAMRCGCAIVTSDVGTTRDVIHDDENGILLSPEGLDESIPAAICRLLDNPSERARLAAGAKQYAAENFWTWDERIAAEIHEVTALLPQEGN